MELKEAEDDWVDKDFGVLPGDYELLEPVDDMPDMQAPLIDDEAVYRIRAADLKTLTRAEQRFRTRDFLKKSNCDHDKSEDESKTVKMVSTHNFEKKLLWEHSDRSGKVEKKKSEESRNLQSNNQKAKSSRKPKQFLKRYQI